MSDMHKRNLKKLQSFVYFGSFLKMFIFFVELAKTIGRLFTCYLSQKKTFDLYPEKNTKPQKENL